MKVIIIGGGLVGSLSAVFFAQKGHDVEMFEYRQVWVQCSYCQNHNCGRCVPCFQCIYSVGRKHLNELLLNEASKMSNVFLHFESKLEKVDPSSGVITVKSKNGQLKTFSGDLIVGADGAFSTVRRDLLKATPINFSQTFIDHGYLELSIPAENNSKMAPNHLHIWPRGKFMMIALPNEDGSWTVTLFMPSSSFQKLSSSEEVLDFFDTHFADATQLIGKDNLVNTYLTTAPSNLVSIKCSRYHFDSKVVIIGDAAHAMVPFFGQGMNAGFEDCTILDRLLHTDGLPVHEALEIFSKRRNPDAEAICDLAMYNYLEMRDLVNKRSFLIRKAADNLFYKLFCARWVPLYQSVTFTNMSYRRCLNNKMWQDKVINTVVFSTFAIIASFLIIYFYATLSFPEEMRSLETKEFCTAKP